MNPLESLQSDFRAFLLHGEESLLNRVAGTARVDAQTRLAIYYDAYRLRLLEALDANYPVLHAWIGDEAFEKLGLAYLDAHPSQHFSIRYFGHCLAEFLSAEHSGDRPYLGEMAALEWALSEAFDAADDELVSIENMADIPPDAWPGMRLRFHASVRRLSLRWNVSAIWNPIHRHIEAEKHSEPPTAEIPPPSAEEYPRSWLIWRQNLKTYFRSLPIEEAWAIDTAVAGGRFAEICEGLTEWIEGRNVALYAAGLLKQWVGNGLISKIHVHREIKLK